MLSAVQDRKEQQRASSGNEQTIANLQAKVEAIPIIHVQPLLNAIETFQAQGPS